MKRIYPLAFFLLAGTLILGGQLHAQSGDQSAKLTKIVKNENGENNEHQPPAATYTAFLNGDKSRVLIENSPQWDGNEKNIPGTGYFTVQYGNFPELKVGDTMRVRFTDQLIGQQGGLNVVADTLPWSDPNPLDEKMYLASKDLPPKPLNLQFEHNSDGKYKISWDSVGNYYYSLYRRDLEDTLDNGRQRNLYVLVSDSIAAHSYIDHPPTGEDHYSYVLYTRNEEGTYSGHSRPMSQERKLLLSVPQPIIPSRPTLVEMYDKAWTLALEKSKRAQPGSGFVDWYLDEAFDDRLFQWDVCFMMTFAKYAQGGLPNIETLDNFYRKQHADGAIAGVLREWNGEDDESRSSPFFTRNNLFSWAEWEYYQATGDSTRFDRVIPVLADYARWVQQNRRHSNGHFWWSGFGSGMDNSPRSTATNSYPPYSWVDYDANEALAARYLVKMARVAGKEQIVDEFSQFHDTMRTLVNRDMWDEENQFYWDLDRDGTFMEIQHSGTGQYRKVKTVASFWPMWADITSNEQVEGLIQHLDNPLEFNRSHRVPTLSADDPAYSEGGDYWRGSVWPPTNHMIVEGLMTQGKKELAREIVVNHLNNLSVIFSDTGTLWENYAPESASPGNSSRPDFVGWSGVGPIAQLIENYIGILPDVPDTTVHWNLLTTREVGLRNLKMSDFTIREIRALSRTSREEPPQLIIDTSKPFTLNLFDGIRDTTLLIEAGRSERTITSLSDKMGEQPAGYKLNQNYPNPFNPKTKISYRLPEATKVNLSIYNIMGRKIRTLLDRKVSKGKHTLIFDASELSSGLYIYRLKTKDHSMNRKMMFLK